MYRFYLAGELMPVAPPSITIKGKNMNKTVTLMNNSEVNILKAPGLDEISFELPFPEFPHPDAEYLNGFQPAGYYMELIRKLKSNKEPFIFTVSRVAPKGGNLSFYYDYDDPSTGSSEVSLESYEFNEDAKEGFWIKAKVTLKQYRAYDSKRINVSTGVEF